MGPNNLVAYDWEVTGPRSEQLHYIGQFFRMVSFREQMGPELASRSWLKVASLGLGNSGTTLTLTAPNQLTLIRKSAIGLSAIELHLLADWLESPWFPLGLHSFLPAPPDLPPQSAALTNSPPVRRKKD